MVEGVGDRTLEEFFGRGVEGLGAGEIVVELLEGSEKAVDFVLPEQGLGIVPCGLALGHGEGPIEQIAQMGEDLRGRTRGFRGAEIGEGVWGGVEDFSATIGDGGEAVTKEIAGAGVRRNHSGVNLAASVREEKMILREAAGREKTKAQAQTPCLGQPHLVHGTEEEKKCKSERVQECKSLRVKERIGRVSREKRNPRPRHRLRAWGNLRGLGAGGFVYGVE